MLQLEPWHVPLLAMTLVVLPPSIAWAIGWIRDQRPSDPAVAPEGPANETPEEKQKKEAEEEKAGSARREKIRLRVLAPTTVALVVICFVAIGTEAANQIATAATALSAVVSSMLTVNSYQEFQRIRRGGEPH